MLMFLGPTGATDHRAIRHLSPVSDVDSLMLGVLAHCATFFVPLTKGVGKGVQDFPGYRKGSGEIAGVIPSPVGRS